VKYWTVDEARAFLPRLRQLVLLIRHTDQMRKGQVGSVNGERSPITEAREAFEELRENDIILRDTETGLIDFHAKGVDGVVYLLCWRLGEDELGWWHLPDEGFPGRKPLPRDQEPPRNP
jgi:hypothetical protein